jgi:hypothetical protein
VANAFVIERPPLRLLYVRPGYTGYRRLARKVFSGCAWGPDFDYALGLQDDIGREGSSLSTIYRSTDGYPEPLRSELKSELRDYTHYIIDKDWPAHRRGIVPVGGEHRLQVIRSTLMSYEPTTKTQELLHNELLRYLDAMMVSREQRLATVTAAIPRVMWYVVVIGAFLTIAFLWMLSHGAVAADYAGWNHRLFPWDNDLHTPPLFLLLRAVFPALFTMLIGVAAILPAPALAGDEVFASVGTGELNGIYYPVGKAICQIVNRDLHSPGIRCSPEATPGSVYNMGAIQSGELQFGIVQSDVQFAAYDGEGAWIGRSFRGLRSVLSLYPELVTVIGRADSHIQDLAGLAGECRQQGYRHPGDMGRHRSGTRLEQ